MEFYHLHCFLTSNFFDSYITLYANLCCMFVSANNLASSQTNYSVSQPGGAALQFQPSMLTFPAPRLRAERLYHPPPVC
jgi:hypothetical protein